MQELTPQPLTAADFAPYGEVIEAPAEAAFQHINDDTCRRYDALARIDVIDGAPGLSIFRAVARTFPFKILMLERHPLGSQAFVPLASARFIVVVAGDADGMPDWRNVRAFVARGQQGINFYRNIWHHPLIAIGQDGDFLVADRLANGNGNDKNLQEAAAPPKAQLQVMQPAAL